MNSATMELIPTTTTQPKFQLCDIIPHPCGPYDVGIHPPRLLDIVTRLRTAYTNAAARLTDPTQTIERHCIAATICYSMNRLVRAENYNTLDILSAIGLEDAGATPTCLVLAWERANHHAYVRPTVASRILLDCAINLQREPLIVGDPGALLASCTELSPNHVRKVMEDAVALTYRTAYNYVCNGSFDAEVILTVHAIEHLDRLGYDEGLVLRAIAVEDVWDLLGKGDISAEDAWKSARKDGPKEAEKRVENARAEVFTKAMNGLNVADEKTTDDGGGKPSHAWIGVLNGSIKDLNVQAQNHGMAGGYTETHDTTMEDLKEKVADMCIVTDEEVMEFEQMLA